jgi:GTPase Era involved in 16S rRNA processing
MYSTVGNYCSTLVLVDIPGINEAGAGARYKEYVANKWNTFDCVVLVMDGRQGVNGVEQVELLNFIKMNGEEKKDVPVIILCNKVDDPEDEDQCLVVDEARKKVGWRPQRGIRHSFNRHQESDQSLRKRSGVPSVHCDVYYPRLLFVCWG